MQPQQTGGLELGAVTPLPERVAVGAGTALFVDGLCRARRPLRRLEAGFGDERRSALGWGMAEPGGRVGGGYWWSLLPIDSVEGPTRATLGLTAELGDRSILAAEVGSLELVPQRSEPGLAEVPPPEAAGGEGPLVAIAMATYEPDPALFRRQIESIRAQSHERWVCVISDDGSRERSLAEMREVIGTDPRFALSGAVANEGHYRNFERALMMVPAGADYVAFSDQDDVWFPHKLEALLEGLGPGSPLVYSDMRLVDPAGGVIADTYWTARRNNYTDFASVVLANTVTGAASLFEASLLERALPFPPRHSALFHDHWIAQVAMAAGPLSYVDRPLQDYVQHPGAALGHAAANGGGRYSGPLGARMRAAIANLRAQGYRPAWRAPYFNVYCRVLLSSHVLRARCGDLLGPERLRVLDRINDSPRGIAWMLGRGGRELLGANETIGRERAILAGFAWRRAAVLRRRARERLGRA